MTKHRKLIDQYLNDVIGRQIWADLAINDEYVALQIIFLEGACFDFSSAVNELTGWPVHEIQWGTSAPCDSDECVADDYGIHRVVQHPSGRYLDASGWTGMQDVLARMKRQDATYQWMGGVDADGGIYDVDFELVKQAVIGLLQQTVGIEITLAENVISPQSGLSSGM